MGGFKDLKKILDLVIVPPGDVRWSKDIWFVCYVYITVLGVSQHLHGAFRWEQLFIFNIGVTPLYTLVAQTKN